MLMRVQKLSLCLWLMAGSMTVGATPILLHSAHNIEEYQLKNGMRIILANNPKESRTYINTIYLTGSLNDPQGKGGLAHLLEHLAFNKGTKAISGDEFQRRLSQYTLSNNASTSYYSTQYSNVVRAEQKAINEILHLEAQRMHALDLKADLISGEIDIVKREREVRLDQPMSVLMDQMVKAAYGNQHLGRLPIGDVHELESIQLQDLQDYYQKWYAPNNAVLVMTGKFDKTSVLKQIDREFSAIAQRALPQATAKTEFDISQLKQRQFHVAKGSDYLKLNFYMQPKNSALTDAMTFAPYLYSLEPTGKLYVPLVESGMATGVMALDASDQERNIAVMAAVYSPQHDAKAINDALIEQVEISKPNFSPAEVTRIQNMQKNGMENALKSSASMMSILTHYVVNREGQWQAYFSDHERLQRLDAAKINHTLQQFLNPQYRISATVEPTPEQDKKAATLATAAPSKTLDQQSVVAPAFKEVKSYQTEVKSYVKSAKTKLQQVEQKIQRGTLDNGVKYALFPTTTRDDKTYATISIDFGSNESLFKRRELVGLTAYLVLRGSAQYERQQLIDESIRVSGNAQVSSSTNSFTIQVSAKKEHFAEYFKFILDNLKQPKFEDKEFELIRNQTLAALDRPYTEPDTVMGFKLAEILEQYQPGDFLYRFDPELSKADLKRATNADIQAFYQQFFNLKHAQVAVTGDFKAPLMLNVLQKELGNWPGTTQFERILPTYKAYPAQKHHVFAEPREFGSYTALLTLPVSSEDQDAPALSVLNHILGGSQLSSRLAKELREKNGLVYGFSSRLTTHRDVKSGALSISANYSAGKSHQVSQAVQQVLQVLIDKGVTEQELEEAKAALLKRRVTNLEDERNIHRMLTNQLQYNETMQSRAARDQAFAKLTTQDLHRVIQTYIKPEQLIEVMADQYGQKPE
ncbi:M16 family metallopeptidase [Acinetobacter sp.]|uniref:M16 family metallopeptidase n=1 Tax=Acinetobacter sp. TaxID=472 RepID=UPI00388EBC0A